jgi:hypothetical protein
MATKILISILFWFDGQNRTYSVSLRKFKKQQPELKFRLLMTTKAAKNTAAIVLESTVSILPISESFV